MVTIILVILMLTGCEQFTDVEKAYVSSIAESRDYYLKFDNISSDRTYRLPSEGGQVTLVVVYSKDVTWEITGPEWIHISPEKGGDSIEDGGKTWVMLTVEPNILGNIRTASLSLRSTVSGWNYTYNLAVEQNCYTSSTMNKEPKITITSLQYMKGDPNLLSDEAIIEDKGNDISEAGFIHSLSGLGSCSFEECMEIDILNKHHL